MMTIIYLIMMLWATHYFRVNVFYWDNKWESPKESNQINSVICGVFWMITLPIYFFFKFMFNLLDRYSQKEIEKREEEIRKHRGEALDNLNTNCEKFIKNHDNKQL